MPHDWLNTQSIIPIQSQNSPPPTLQPWRGRGQQWAGLGAGEQRAGPPGAASTAAHPGVLPLSC